MCWKDTLIGFTRLQNGAELISKWSIFNGAETNCRIAHILGILLMNSCNTDRFLATTVVCGLSTLNYFYAMKREREGERGRERERERESKMFLTC